MFCVNERIKFVQMAVNIRREFATPSSSLSTIQQSSAELVSIISNEVRVSAFGCHMCRNICIFSNFQEILSYCCDKAGKKS